MTILSRGQATAMSSSWIFPCSHDLESWGDAELAGGAMALGQRAMAPIFDTRALEDILMACVRRAGLREAYVEMICTRGFSPTFSRDPRDAINTFMAFAIPFSSVANEAQRAVVQRRDVGVQVGMLADQHDAFILPGMPHMGDDNPQPGAGDRDVLQLDLPVQPRPRVVG